MVPQVAFAALGILAVLGGWMDIRSRRIPNLLCLVVAMAGLVWAYANGGWSSVPWHLAHLLVALIVGMGIYAVKYWGGGDAKFYAGLAAWFPLADFFVLVMLISAFGLALVFAAFIIKKRQLGGPVVSGPLPYGVALAAGALASFLIRFSPI